jgi:hypothetical protein
MRRTNRTTWLLSGLGVVAAVFTLAVALPFGLAAQVENTTTAISPLGSGAHHLALSPTNGSLAPNASGTVTWIYGAGHLSGAITVSGLPAQGLDHAYVAWYVNTATGDKAFLGPLIETGEGTVLFETSGSGALAFSVTSWTNGSSTGLPIHLAPVGSNLFVVLVENAINFASPSPIGSAVSVAF